MIISYQGLESFKISQGDLSVVVNPKSKMTADVTLVSSSAFATDTKEGTFVVKGPGEYEIKDVGVKGFLSKSSYGGGERINTIYVVSFEGVNLAFLGALSDDKLPTETLEHLDDIDILFIPVGGGDVLDAATAYKLAVSLEPSVIIPMHYNAESLKKFLKEAGSEGVEALDKLVIKKKDLEGKQGEIIILKEE